MLADRVKETSTTTGTGTLDLDGPVSKFVGFVSAIGTTNSCHYAIVHQTAAEWEVGIGVVTDATPDTLSRNTVLASSNAGALVSFTAGTMDVFVDSPADILDGTVKRSYTQAAHGFAAGDVINMSGSTWGQAQADTAINAEAEGVVESVTTDTFVVVFHGRIKLTGLTAGDLHYLSAGVAGDTVTTAPSIVGQIRRPIFKAITSTEAVVNILLGFEVADSVRSEAAAKEYTQNAHGFSVGNALYRNGSTWSLSKADAAATAEVEGIIESVTTNTFVLVFHGHITLSGLTAGEVYYLSAATAGAATNAPPATTGQIRKPLYTAITTTSAVINPMLGFEVTDAATPLTRGFIDGFIMSNDTDADHDVNVTVGTARDSADGATLTLASETTKQIDAAWAVGNDAGGLLSGTVAIDTWYHVFLIRRSDTGVVDVGFNIGINPTANLPANYDSYRRVGSVLTDASSNILGFSQFGDVFHWNDPPLDFTDTTLGTTMKTYVISTPPDVRTFARMRHYFWRAALGAHVYIHSDVANDEAPSGTGAPHGQSMVSNTGVQTIWESPEILTSTSSQINARADAASSTIHGSCLGWRDLRGRNA